MSMNNQYFLMLVVSGRKRSTTKNSISKSRAFTSSSFKVRIKGRDCRVRFSGPMPKFTSFMTLGKLLNATYCFCASVSSYVKNVSNIITKLHRNRMNESDRINQQSYRKSKQRFKSVKSGILKEGFTREGPELDI